MKSFVIKMRALCFSIVSLALAMLVLGKYRSRSAHYGCRRRRALIAARSRCVNCRLLFSIASCAANCPENWHRFEQKCYYVNLTSVHSKFNKELCDSLNATMVSIHTAAENEFLRRLLFIHYDSHKWVWLSRARNHNKSHGYVWTDKSPFNYSNWVAPDVECSVCCEITLMTSGHWFGSNCNTWTFTQLCQKVLPPTDEPPSAVAALGDNYYLNQFGDRNTVGVDPAADIKPNVSELVEWLAYEVEAVKDEVQRLNETTHSHQALEETLYDRDYYLLSLLSIIVTLLLVIMLSLILIYYMLVRKMRIMSSFCDK